MKLSISDQIEMIRSEMVSTAMKNGLNHPETIRLSKCLDRLLNMFDHQRAAEGVTVHPPCHRTPNERQNLMGG